MPSALIVKRFVPAYAKRFVPALATLAGRAGVERLSLCPTRAFVRRPLMVYTPGFLWRESDIAFPKFQRMSPQYEITDTNEEFKVSFVHFTFIHCILHHNVFNKSSSCCSKHIFKSNKWEYIGYLKGNAFR